MFANLFRKKKNLPPIQNVRSLTDNGFEPIESYLSAKKVEGAYVVMHGDDGGQVYLTVPLANVRASEKNLEKLLAEIDSHAWNDPRTRLLYYEKGFSGKKLVGGMGGGQMQDNLWVHPKLEELRSYIDERLNTK